MARGPVNAEDAKIGARIRARRLLLNMSQTALAEPLNITFQQVQKYEKGTNRIGGSRMMQIAALLKTTPSALFGEGVDPKDVGKDDELTQLAATPGAVDLLRALAGLTPKQRTATLRLVEAMAEAD